jgi:glycosyltransferase involved in cell wall biosynthesis
LIDRHAANLDWRGLDVLVVSPTPTHPQDHGNRKRIYQICASLKQRGAKIHFIHYPAEHDWRKRWPLQHENAMRAAWDTYQLVAPGVSLHANSLGVDHTIDEWADPSLSQYIDWVCRRRAFDVMIVNYTWMSFCLEAAPADVFKILDTHDVFAGRRELLEAHEVGPEFFHTTRSEEAKGLARAHLVWAIKPSEQTYFEQELGVGDCLTMLHADPDQGCWEKPPSQDGWLRAGTIGARNNINRHNLEAFLSSALPIFERYWAPVKIVIAGGCCDDFATLDHPNVEILGRVESVSDFYRSIDVAIAPMEFSTGLKIKVSEALASGAPLIAHAHAMEGYPTRERLHLLTSFESMAMELATLSFERAPLTALAQRSRAVNAAIQASVNQALKKTRANVLDFSANALLFIAPFEALDPKSLLSEHLQAALDYLRFAGRVTLYIVGRVAKEFKLDMLDRYELTRRQFVDPDVARQMGDGARDVFVSSGLKELKDTRGYLRAYVMTDALDPQQLRAANFDEIYVRPDAIELAGGDPGAFIDALGHANVVVLDNAPARSDRAGVRATVAVPFRSSGSFESLALRARPGASPMFLLLLADHDDLIGQQILALVARLGLAAKRLGPRDPGFANVIRGRVAPADDDPLANFAQAHLMVDLLAPNSLAAILREAALRFGIPCITLARGAAARSYLAFPDPLRAASVGQLLERVAEAALDRQFYAALRETVAGLRDALFDSDAGWSELGDLLAKPLGGAAPSE